MISALGAAHTHNTMQRAQVPLLNFLRAAATIDLLKEKILRFSESVVKA